MFEGDFLGCFDHLNHHWIVEQTSTFPGNTLIKRWLKMGYIEQDMLHKTTEGTPQGRPPKKQSKIVNLYFRIELY